MKITGQIFTINEIKQDITKIRKEAQELKSQTITKNDTLQISLTH